MQKNKSTQNLLSSGIVTVLLYCAVPALSYGGIICHEINVTPLGSMRTGLSGTWEQVMGTSTCGTDSKGNYIHITRRQDAHSNYEDTYVHTMSGYVRMSAISLDLGSGRDHIDINASHDMQGLSFADLLHVHGGEVSLKYAIPSYHCPKHGIPHKDWYVSYEKIYVTDKNGTHDITISFYDQACMASVADTTGIYLAEVQEHIKYTIVPDVSLKLIPESLPIKIPVNDSTSGTVRLVTNAREHG